MRIWIDATPLLLRSAGVKNYLYYWIVHLRRAAPEHTILAFPFLTRLGELNHERSQAGLGATIASLALLQFLNRSHLPWRGGAVDVFHASNQLRNPPRKTKVTSTVHDMTCWLTPELHRPSNARGGRRFDQQVLKRADGLLAVSENTRRDAIRILGLAPERIETVYPGIADAFFQATAETVEAARQRHGLARPYVLFVGTVEPRKNIATLLEAYGRLGRAFQDEFELVVAGPAGWTDRGTLERLRSGTAGVRYLGYVPESDLPGITAGASALAYPSLYEGFGFPVAQAMAAGVPVITSNLSSLPEIAGGAALLVDPRSTAEIRSALERLLGSPSLREELGRKGRERAQLYRWEVCARRSIEFFERVAGASG